MGAGTYKGNPKMPVRVVLGVREGTAKEGVDFTFGKRDIIFPVGNKLDSVKIDLIDNDVYDVDRSFQVGFDSIQGGPDCFERYVDELFD